MTGKKKEKGKFCPLLNIVTEDWMPCQEERCAWWDKVAGWCVLKSIGQGIYGINDSMPRGTLR